MMARRSRSVAAGVTIGRDRVDIHVPGLRSDVVGSLPLPPGGPEDGLVRPEIVGPLLRRWFRDQRVRPTSIKFAVDLPQERSRTLRLPFMPEGERALVIRGELEATCGLPVGTGAVDFAWLELPVQEGARHEADVVAFFITEPELEAWERLAQQVGASFGGVEPSSWACIRSVLGDLPQSPSAVLHVSETHCDLVVADGHRVRVIRRIAGLRRAEPAPSVVPAVDAPDIPGFSNATPPSAEVLPVDDGLGFVVGEVARTLAFHARNHPESRPIDAVVLIGSVDEYRRFRSAGSSYGLNWQTIPDLDAEGGPGCRAAAAVASLESPHGFAPLALERERQQARLRRRTPVMVRLAAGASLAALSMAVGATLSLAREEDRAIRGKLEEVARMEAINERRGDRIQFLSMVESATVISRQAGLPVSELLGRLAVATTSGVSIGRFEVRGDGSVVIEGDSVDARSAQSFAVRLGRDPRIREPRFESMRQAKDGSISFRVAARFRASKEGNS